MGGRKTYPVKKILGDLRETTRERKTLKKAISQQNPKKIAQATLDVFRNSTSAVSNLSKTYYMLKFVREFEKTKATSEDIKKDVTSFWTNIKENKGIKLEHEMERVLIDSTTHILKREVKK